MPRSNQPPAENFLSPRHAAQLESLDAAMTLMDPQPGSGISVNAQMGQAMMRIGGAMHEYTRFVRRESKAIPANARATADGRERLYQLFGFHGAVVDLGLRFSTDMAATVTGDMLANDPENAPAGYEAGEEIILDRARNAASTVLRAAGTIYKSHDDAPDSAWDRANAVHRKGKAKAGPKIKSREYSEFDELSVAATEAPLKQAPPAPFKHSRFFAVTLFRAAKAARKDLPEGQDTSGSAMIQKSRDLLGNTNAHMPEPLELTPAQIVAVMGTATKVLKHVRNAARVDTSIGNDPSLRYFSYTLSRLGGGYAIGSEIAAYKRRAEQTAAQLRQFSSDPTP